MINFNLKKYIKCKKPVFAGFLCFLPVVLVQAQALPSYASLSDIFYYHQLTIDSIPDSTKLKFRCSYQPLLSEKADSKSDKYNSSMNSADIGVNCFLKTARNIFYFSGNYSDLFSAYRQDSKDYSFQMYRGEFDLAVGICNEYKTFTNSIGIGRHMPLQMDREHFSDVKTDFKKYLTEGPWQFSYEGNYSCKPLSVKLLLFSGLVHTSLSKLATKDGSSFRTFPLSIVKRSVSGKISIEQSKVFSELALGVSAFKTCDLIESKNSMPEDIVLNSYFFDNCGWLKEKFTDSLFWSLSGTIAGGYITSYNFSKNLSKFFNADSIRLKSIQGLAGLRLPFDITTGISGVISAIEMPESKLELSALSSWSVFVPLDYRIDRAEVNFTEAGLFVNKPFSWKLLTIIPDIAVSYIHAEMNYSYSQKKIVVLLPVYLNKKTVDAKANILMLAPSLTFKAAIGKCIVSASVLQRIPIVINNDKKEGEGSGNNEKTSFTGGTSLRLSVDL